MACDYTETNYTRGQGKDHNHHEGIVTRTHTGHSAMEWMISFDRFKCNWSSDLRLKRKFETSEGKKIIEINVRKVRARLFKWSRL